MKRLVLVFASSFLSCAAAGAAATSAVINTAVAAGVSGVRRAQGDCFTICNSGTTCNRETGMCDTLPCRGECRFDEKCELTPTGDRCVPNKPTSSP